MLGPGPGQAGVALGANLQSKTAAGTAGATENLPVRRPLDLVFMGTPAFAATILAQLIDQATGCPRVYSQPPRPAGRGHRLNPRRCICSPGNTGSRCATRRHAAQQDEQAAFCEPRTDAAVVAAYGLILPAAYSARAAFRLRQRARLAAAALARRSADPAGFAGRRPGDRRHDHADGGRARYRPDPAAGRGAGRPRSDRPPGFRPSSRSSAARLLLAALDGIVQGRLAPQPQPPEGVTYAPNIRRDEAWLDWRRGSVELERRVRALANPGPGPFSRPAASASGCYAATTCRARRSACRARCSTTG